MGIGKKSFLMPCILFAIFFTVNINAGQERDNAISEVRNGETVSVASVGVGDSEQRHGVNNPIKPEIAHKMKKLQIPFIANDGQADEKVKFYANTFAGSVFVTKDGEIVYALPGRDKGQDAGNVGANGRSPMQGRDMMDYGPRVTENGIRTTSEFLDLFLISHLSSAVHGELVEPSNQVGWIKALSFAPNPSTAESQYLVDSHSLNRSTERSRRSPPYNTGIPQSATQNLSPTSIGDPQSDANDVALKEDASPRPLRERDRVRGLSLKETFIGAKISEVKGEGYSATKVSYFKGNDPAKWKNNISTHDFVDLGDVYEGIGLRLKAYGNNVEKLFTVKPGANPEQIKIRLSGIRSPENPPPLSPSLRGTVGCPPLAGAGGGLGARGLSVNKHGELEIETELGPVKFSKPVAYQEIDGKRVYVDVEYDIQKVEAGMLNQETRSPEARSKRTEVRGKIHAARKNGTRITENGNRNNSAIQNLSSTSIGDPKSEYSFKVAAYDTTKDLIIDPLLASTYLGGSWFLSAWSLALDRSGNVYVTGEATSTDFPTTSGAYDTSYNGGSNDVFVSKLDSGLTSLIASTFLGGSNDDGGRSIVLDTSGNVYVTGNTNSSNFPTTSGAYDTSYNVGSYITPDIFISKLDSGLTSLIASTFLGGSNGDGGPSIVLDTSGNVYVTGNTNSSNFPTTSGAYDTSFIGQSDVFISKLDGGLKSLLASTFLGGTNTDYGYSLALNTSGNVYVTGWTHSSNFPTTIGAYDTSVYNVNYWGGDVFVSELDSGLTSLLASTFLGGSGLDRSFSLALDRSGNVYVTGDTQSTDFPTTIGAYDTSFNGYYDVFVSKLDSGLVSLLASTYLGGSDGDMGHSLTLDTTGKVYVTGYAISTDFPTTSGAYVTSHNGNYDVFVSKLEGGLTDLFASTFLGGYADEWGNSLSIATSGNVYVTGVTRSANFPTTSGAYDTSFNSGSYFSDVFVSKFYFSRAACEDRGLSLLSIVPESGGDTGSVTMTIYGCEFQGSATAKLARDDQPDIEADPVNVADDGKSISATFDLTGKASGLYDVVITNPDDTFVTLADAFTVEEGKSPEVWVDIVGRSSIMVGRTHTFYILIGNHGNIDAKGLIGVGGIPNSATWKIELPAPVLNGVQVDWNQLPIQTETENEINLMLPILFTVPPVAVQSFGIKLTTQTVSDFQIKPVWVGQ